MILFDGWAFHPSPAPDHIKGHPFHAANNINGIAIHSIVDYQVLPLDAHFQAFQAFQAFQEAYIRKVIDTVHNLPNVLYVVANESSGGVAIDETFAQILGQTGLPDWGDSTDWQYWFICFIREYEQAQGYERPPIGMTMQFPVADQIPRQRTSLQQPGRLDLARLRRRNIHRRGYPMAPGSPPSRWYDDPPVNDGSKVVITDTDHYAPGKGDALWAWKSFLHAHHIPSCHVRQLCCRSAAKHPPEKRCAYRSDMHNISRADPGHKHRALAQRSSPWQTMPVLWRG